MTTPFSEGYEAYNAQQKSVDNPYPVGTDDYYMWLSGWGYALDQYLNIGNGDW
jgi:hypothetical protein